MKLLSKIDPEVSNLLKAERRRQKRQLQMIPSENYASKAVMEAVGSCFMNKYSEGQPHKRYYQGMANVDELELLVEKRALKTFGLKPDVWDVNVQPYSGSPANAEVFMALLNPGDTVMPMYLSDGGHISHGWSFRGKSLSFASKFFKVEFYHVDRRTRLFNYDQIRKQAKKTRPKLIISGGTAYPRDINYREMGRIAKDVGAYYLADVAHEAGLIAAKVNKSPFAYADVVTMTTHKTLRGPRGALIFAKKNLIQRIDKAVFPGLQGGPHNHTIAGIGVALYELITPSFRTYAKQVVRNAKALAKELMKRGYDVVSGGTDKHLVLIDLRNKGVTGKIPAIALERANIIMNFNTVPFDTSPPLYPSGLRMGTPALTSRGMKTQEMKKISEWIDEVIQEVSSYKLPKNPKERSAFILQSKKQLVNNKRLKRISKEVSEFARKYPVPN